MKNIIIPLFILLLFGCKKSTVEATEPIQPPQPPIVNNDILFTRNSELFILDTSAHTETQITNFNQNGTLNFTTNSARWNSDKTKIVFKSTKDNPRGEIYIANADGTSVMRLTNDTSYDYMPKISPDGSKIAFVRSVSNSNWSFSVQELFLMNVDGTNITQLTDLNSNVPMGTEGTGSFFDICWNGDSEIYFISDYETEYYARNYIYKYQLNNSSVSLVPSYYGRKTSIDISPDGRFMVYACSRRLLVILAPEICSSKIDGSDQQLLTNYSQDGTSPGAANFPSWTSNGKIMFVTIKDTESGEIYIMDSDGSNISRITNNTLREDAPFIR